MGEGWEGWDEYAPFYDWENARTLGRRDVSFWRVLASKTGGRVLELGCGTGRISIPLARAAAPVIGIDRSADMLARARHRLRRTTGRRPILTRGDIRSLPFRDASFDLVIAPYGVLQSLVRESDLRATLAGVARVLGSGGTFGVDLVPDLPAWKEYRRQIRLQGYRHRGTAHLTLIESVRQDRRRHLTFFDQEFVERRGSRRTTRRFSLTFRTLGVRQMGRRLEREGFQVSATLGDYNGQRWDPRAEVWVILATKG